MKDYRYILREHHLKATPQRLVIMDIIDTKGHITIDKLYKMVKVKFNTISLATIYKNINNMIENKLLFEVKVPNQKSVYEIAKAPHSHLLCKSCSQVVDIDLDMSDLEKTISKTHNFIVDQKDLIFSGTCQHCK